MAELKLTSGKASAIVSTIGAEIISYTAPNGREYIWCGDPAVWGNHTPMLFPACSATIEDKVKFGGVEYPLGKHGFTRKIPFLLGKHGEDFAEFYYDSNPETLKQYPFEFRLHVTYTITERGFSVTFLVENKSGKRMPMCIGGHPGFACPIYDGEKFEDYELKFECAEGEVENMTLSDGTCVDGKEQIALKGGDTLPLSHALFDERDALVLPSLKSRVVRMVNSKTGKGFAFDFHKFDVLAVWSAPKKDGDYLCLEPWCGLPALKGETGNFEDKPFVKFVEPQECFKVGYSLEVID